MTTQTAHKCDFNKTRENALSLLREYTKNEGLIRHAFSVEAALRWYARHYGEDEDYWGITGLLHDFDYERYPEIGPEGHPFMGCKILEEQAYPREMIEAILGHANYSGIKRETLLAKGLFACDELTGLITASVLVRPDRSIHTLTAKSVKKKMKDKAFARAVNREDIILGTDELGVDLSEHITNVISGMRTVADEIGLSGL